MKTSNQSGAERIEQIKMQLEYWNQLQNDLSKIGITGFESEEHFWNWFNWELEDNDPVKKQIRKFI